jgi:hypothetical protein
MPQRARRAASATAPFPARITRPQTFVLHVKAELENVRTLSLQKSAHYCIDVKESAGSEQRDGVYVTANDTHELSGSKGTANVSRFESSSLKGGDHPGIEGACDCVALVCAVRQA